MATSVPAKKDWRPTTVGALFVALFFSSLLVPLSIATFPDSSEYMDHARDLAGHGLVQLGYRQFGYPTLLWFGNAASAFPGVNDLSFVVVVQRLVLVGGITYAIVLLRWFAAPLVVLGLSPTTVAYTNVILTEGIGLGTAIVLGLLVVHCDRRLRSGNPDSIPIGLLAAICSTFIVLAVTRFHTVVLLPAAVIPMVRAWHCANRSERRQVAVLGAVWLLALFGFFAGTTMENANEYGIAAPSVRGEGPSYWSAWRIVFTETDPELAVELPDLYAEGDEYSLLIATRNLAPDEERQTLAEARSRLLEASRLSMFEHRVRATWGAVTGGRIDDLGEAMSTIAEQRVPGVDRLPDTRSVLSILLPLALCMLAASLALEVSRWLAAAGMLPLLALILGTGFLLLDNTRFLLVPAAAILAIACGSTALIWTSMAVRSSLRTGRRVPLSHPR